jgi:hypothetical protein
MGRNGRTVTAEKEGQGRTGQYKLRQVRKVAPTPLWKMTDETKDVLKESPRIQLVPRPKF